MECPLCFAPFHAEEIQEHAAQCQGGASVDEAYHTVATRFDSELRHSSVQCEGAAPSASAPETRFLRLFAAVQDVDTCASALAQQSCRSNNRAFREAAISAMITVVALLVHTSASFGVLEGHELLSALVLQTKGFFRSVCAPERHKKEIQRWLRDILQTLHVLRVELEILPITHQLEPIPFHRVPLSVLSTSESSFLDPSSETESPAQAQPQTQGRGVALILANSYSDQPEVSTLVSSERDAQLLSTVLSRMGCEFVRQTRFFLDMPLATIHELIQEAGKMLEREEVAFLFVYFAGHGRRSCVMAANGQIMELDDVYGLLHNDGSSGDPVDKPKLFFWDCCRSGRVNNSQGSENPNRQRVRFDNYFHCHATSPGGSAQDGRSHTSSPFNEALRFALLTSKDRDLYAITRVIKRETTSGQQPFSEDSLTFAVTLPSIV